MMLLMLMLALPFLLQNRELSDRAAEMVLNLEIIRLSQK
jgi:hypothetical protein